MANLPISGLTELAAAPAEDDEVEILDKSDTTYHANGTNKRNKISNLRKGIQRIVAESSDFTLDAAVHTDGCKILVDPAAGTVNRMITLMTLATQPAAGYQIHIIMTGTGSLAVQTNDAGFSAGTGAICSAIISYQGSDNWFIEMTPNGNGGTVQPLTGILTNADA